MTYPPTRSRVVFPEGGLFIVSGDAEFYVTFEEALAAASLTKGEVQVYHLTEAGEADYHTFNQRQVAALGWTE